MRPFTKELFHSIGLTLLLFPGTLQAQQKDFLSEMFSLSSEQRQRLQAVEVPLAQEQEYGRKILAAYKQHLQQQKIPLQETGRNVRYLDQLVSRIHPLMKHAKRYSKIKVHLVDSKNVDARSCPGGFLFFTQGLLDIAESEAALVGIVGHELSHLDRGHQLKPLQQQILMQQPSNNPFGKPTFDFAEFFDAGKMMFNAQHPFHPDEEAEADEDAVRWLDHLGYDPAQLAKLFSRLASAENSFTGFMPSFMQTHPAYPDRATRILDRIPSRDMQRREFKPIVGNDNLTARRPAELPQAAPVRQRR